MAKKVNFNLDAYSFIVRRLPGDEGGGYLVEYPDVPNCIADCETIEDAIRRGREGLHVSRLS